MIYGNGRVGGDGSSELSCIEFESWLFYCLTFRSWRELKWHHDKMIIFFHTCRHLEIVRCVWHMESTQQMFFPFQGQVHGEWCWICMLFCSFSVEHNSELPWPLSDQGRNSGCIWPVHSNQSGEESIEPATCWRLSKLSCRGLNSACGTLVGITHRSLFFKHGDKAKWSNCQNPSKNPERNNSVVCIVIFFPSPACNSPKVYAFFPFKCFISSPLS